MFLFLKRMNYKIEKTPNNNEADSLFCKTQGLNNPKTMC